MKASDRRNHEEAGGEQVSDGRRSRRRQRQRRCGAGFVHRPVEDGNRDGRDLGNIVLPYPEFRCRGPAKTAWLTSTTEARSPAGSHIRRAAACRDVAHSTRPLRGPPCLPSCSRACSRGDAPIVTTRLTVVRTPQHVMSPPRLVRRSRGAECKRSATARPSVSQTCEEKGSVWRRATSVRYGLAHVRLSTPRARVRVDVEWQGTCGWLAPRAGLEPATS